MKIVFALIFMILFLSANAQCTLITEKDQTTGKESKSTKFVEVAKFGIYDQIKFKIAREGGEDSILRLYVQLNHKKSKCISSDSKILISTDSGIVSLKLMGQITSETQYDINGAVSGLVCCGRELNGYADLSYDQINILKKIKMNGLRVYYPGEYIEFRVINDYRNQSEYFIKTLKCFN